MSSLARLARVALRPCSGAVRGVVGQTSRRVAPTRQYISRARAAQLCGVSRTVLCGPPSRALAAHGAPCALPPVRRFSAPPDYEERLDTNTYHKVSNDTLDVMEEAFEYLEDDASIKDFDCALADGVLTLRLGDRGTYVINKQAPNKQLWLSSPISGPKRYFYDLESGEWLNTRDGHALLPLLVDEIEQLTGASVSFE